MLAAVAWSVARDPTDSAENQAVLDCASALAGGEMTVEGVAVAHGAAVAAEAEAVCRSRARLMTAGGAMHLSVVWAMYGETGRMVTREEHPHGEDFVRVKARQLDWLTDGTGVSWSVVAVDDGCPDTPSSAEVMRRIVASEGYAAEGHRGVTVLRLADLIDEGPSIGPAFDRLTGPEQSRKGGLDHRRSGVRAACVRGEPARGGVHGCGSVGKPCPARHARGPDSAASVAWSARSRSASDRSARPAVRRARGGAREAWWPVREPFSTAGKPDKIIVLFRHAVRAALIPELAHVPDTQAGFKAFDAAALGTVLAKVSSFDETFDVELLIHSAQQYGAAALAIEPIVFTEDFAATNFPSVDPGARHLAMIEQVVQLYDRLIAPTRPAGGEAAALLELVRGLDLHSYGQLIDGLRAEDAANGPLFDRRWPAAHLRALLDVAGV